MSLDDLGDRMKRYERLTSRQATPLLPVCARIDGKNFSSWTRDLKRPYDERLSIIMSEVTRFLVEETSALVGYTQSDEISLVFFSDKYKSQIFMDGKIDKMVSLLASMATAKFNDLVSEYGELAHKPLAFFDARVWVTPSKEEAANYVLWRVRDATKNSVAMAARTVYSHKQLFKKNGSEMQEMLHQAGINWNDYPTFFKRGSWFRRVKTERPFSAEEIEKLPPKHEARTNPDLTIVRTDLREIEMPPFGKVVNRSEVIFDGADPMMRSVVVA